MNTISIQRGLFIQTLTEKDVADMASDITFLCDAILALGNPEKANSNPDIPFHAEDYAKGVRDILIKEGYSMEAFDSCYPQYKTT